MFQTSWNIAGTESVTWLDYANLYCDLYLVSEYSTLVTSAPTQADFYRNPGFPVIWIHNVGDKVVIDHELIENNNVPVYLVGRGNGKALYSMSLTARGLEVTIDDVDATMKRAEAPPTPATTPPARSSCTWTSTLA